MSYRNNINKINEEIDPKNRYNSHPVTNYPSRAHTMANIAIYDIEHYNKENIVLTMNDVKNKNHDDTEAVVDTIIIGDSCNY